MLSTAYYFLQVLLCSAIMMGYYWVVLRNKRFHQYNRFYLLAVAVLSWIVPLIKIQWSNAFAEGEQVIRFLSVVADNNTELEAVVKSKGFHWGMESVLSLLYFAVGGFLLLMMIHALYQIYRLLKKYPCKKVEDVFLIITQAKGTPFSFFRYIFWNDEIDIRSASGKQILQHEFTHVQQKHSVDKLLIQLVLIAGWFNPFFWLLKKEMEMIHEFIADKKSVRDGDTAALAQMLLTAVYPQQRFELTHPFFFSPIKRRLQMLTNNKNPRFSYLRRLVALPLLAVLVVLFAFRSPQLRNEKPISVASVVENVVDDFRAHVVGDPSKLFSATPLKSVALNKTYTIVINPGHGGEDVGARGYDGTKESDLSLAFAKKIKELNTNPNIRVVLTRETDIFNTVVEVAEIATKSNPDLFISIHTNSAAPTINSKTKTKTENPAKGAELYLSSREKSNDYENSYLLANFMGNAISSVVNPFLGIKSRPNGIYVLQAMKCPSILVEAGFVSNREELKLLKDESYQSKMAISILEGVELYLKQKEQNGNQSNFTVMNATKTEIFTAEKDDQNNDPSGIKDFRKRNPDVKQVYWQQSPFRMIVELKDGTEEAYNLEKAESKNRAIKKYGKLPIAAPAPPMMPLMSSETNDKSGSQMKSPAQFPGGEPAWKAYLERNLNLDIPVSNGADTGKHIVKVSFIVESTGKLSDIKIEQDPGFGTSAEVIRVLQTSPNWKPAVENGKPIASRCSRSVTFVVSDESETVQVKDVVLEKLYAQTDVPPSFPGGVPAWAKYLQRNLDADIVKRKGGPPGKYTVQIAFQVDEQGKISNVRATNDPGYGAKEEAIRMIARGPNWKPAQVKGKAVRAEHKMSISFVVAEP